MHPPPHPMDAQAADLTVSAYLAQWLRLRVDQVEPETWLRTKQALRNYVEPTMGDVALAALSVRDFNRLYARLHAGGGRGGRPLSRSTVRSVHDMLHKAFDDAVDLGVLSINPAHRATVPKLDHTDDAAGPRHTVWTVEQLRTFLEHTRDDRFADLWLLAAMTGMRRGELLGLGWDDVALDADRPWLRVRRSLAGTAARPRLKETKTTRPRSLHIDRRSVAALRRRRTWQAQQQRERGPAWHNPWNLVFTDHHGRPLAPNRVTAAFRHLLRTVPVPPKRLHDLRHLHATLMLQAGVPIKVVSERLGHASAQVTMDTYAHVLPAMDADAVTAFMRHVFPEHGR